MIVRFATMQISGAEQRHFSTNRERDTLRQNKNGSSKSASIFD